MREPAVTVLADAVRGLLALPVAHHYTLLATARAYVGAYAGASAGAPADPSDVPGGDPRFFVPPLFEDPFSDRIPPERVAAVRAAAGDSRAELLEGVRRTVRTRLRAMEAVVRRLQRDLGRRLVRTAPPLRALAAPRPLSGVSAHGQLWYAHAAVDAALAAQQVVQRRALPPAEREARYVSARATRRLVGRDRCAALTAMGLADVPERDVYVLRPGSREVVCAPPGDFTWAIAPEAEPGLLERTVAQAVAGDPALTARFAGLAGRRMEQALSVTVQGIDREAGLLAVDATAFPPPLAAVRDALVETGRLDLSRDVILDRVAVDFFTDRLRAVLEAIGNPPRAVAAAADDGPGTIGRAVGRPVPSARPAPPTPRVPVEDLLWHPAIADAPVDRDADLSLPDGRTLPEVVRDAGYDLDASQWRAWRRALTRRLTVVWGPPGTGKSRTVRAIVLGAVLEAAATGRRLRVLVCAGTYTAVDTVLRPLAGQLPALAPDVRVHRLRSTAAGPPDWAAEAAEAGGVEGGAGTGRAAGLDVDVGDRRARRAVAVALDPAGHDRGSGTVVAGTPQQVSRLLTQAMRGPVADAFDLIVLDEAGQLDVAHAVLALAGAAEGASLVVAGDPLQLPPITQTEPPAGLEDLVGSASAFYERHHGVAPARLEVNYRSNRTMVELAHAAGYARTLTARAPDLRLRLLDPLPRGDDPPPGWPAVLHWTPRWADLLDPDRPAVCFVYPEGRSGQWNAFEADAVAALAWLLSRGRPAERLVGEEGGTGDGPHRDGLRPVDAEVFWRRVVGVVTPHRAQRSRIVRRLQQVFAPTGEAAGKGPPAAAPPAAAPPAAVPALIADAVDTVERFQGQQRDVIVASYAVGDPDTVADEEAFLHSLNRFNVMVSRARAKLVVLVSAEVVHHMAGDPRALRESALLKGYAETFCDRRDPDDPVALGWVEDGAVRAVHGSLRWRR